MRSLADEGSRRPVNASRDRAGVAATRIGDLARSCGVTQRALRHYEDEGLICSSRTRQGERLFTPRQSDIAHLVVQLRSMDVAIADIRAFMDDAIPEATRVLVLRQQLERQATEMSSRLVSLRRFLDGDDSLPLGLPRLAAQPARAHRFG
ncbi:MerR family transcriptional regulator [Brevundimonas intermedia]|uniref:MerR family transcriptional regulator n=1 Tax=Brevundimonas intermedia TaxID=74315 RepID=UPI001430610C|nr:MerR family transcriptional regulator [Brevundimonas intermedia]